MKPALLILFLFATLAASASASKAISFLGDDPYSITRFDVSDTGHLDVQTSGGHILVVGTDERVARVEMHVRKNGRNLTKADTDLTGFDIVIEKQGQTLVAKAERSTRIGNLLDGLSSTSISFTVYVPRGFTSNVRTSGGRIGIQNMISDQVARTSGGSMSMENIRGLVDARTSGGAITIKDVYGNLRASTSGGSIQANGMSGEIDLSTSGGGINIDNAMGRIHASTSGGGIIAKVSEVSGSLRLSTSGGSLNVTLPASQGFDIDARGSRVVSDMSRFNGSNERGRMSGTVNGGGIPVRLTTSAGTVRISYE